MALKLIPNSTTLVSDIDKWKVNSLIEAMPLDH